jgi:hypothetical protein
MTGPGLTFDPGEEGRIVYVNSSLQGDTNANLLHDATNGSTVLRTANISTASFPLRVVSGAQGVNNSISNLVEYRIDDPFGSGVSNKDTSVNFDLWSRRPNASQGTILGQRWGFDGVSANFTAVQTFVYDFTGGVGSLSKHVIHPRRNETFQYHSTNTGISEMGYHALYSRGGNPVNGFGGKVTYALPISGTFYNAVAHNYSWHDSGGLGQYTLEAFDHQLNASSPDFDVIQAKARDTRITGWTTTTNAINNSLSVDTDMATSSTVANGFGTGITLTAKTTTTARRDLGAIEAFWTTATDASASSTLRLRTNLPTVGGPVTGIDISQYNISLTNNDAGTRISPYSSPNTNGSLIFTPKGTGGFILGTSVFQAGFERGHNTIDMQYQRTLALSIAAANYSTIIGGKDNRISSTGTNAVVFGGVDNALAGPNAAILAGNNNTVASGSSNSVVLGGTFNVANTTAPNSVVMGRNAQSYIKNSFVIGSSSLVDTTAIHFLLKTTTGSNSAFDLLVEGTDQLLQRASTTWIINALIVGRGSTVNNNWAYRMIGCHRRETGTTGAIVGTVQVPTTERFESSVLTPPTMVSVSGHPVLRVYGAAGQQVKWVAYVTVSEVSY